MSLAIDAIILLSAVIIIWRGAGRGLVKSVMGLVTSVVSFVVAYAYTPVLADIVRDKYLSEPITNGIFETLKSLAFDTNTDLYNLDRLAVDMPEPFTSILERYNVNITTFTEKIKGITGCGENTVRAFAEEKADLADNRKLRFVYCNLPRRIHCAFTSDGGFEPHFQASCAEPGKFRPRYGFRCG